MGEKYYNVRGSSYCAQVGESLPCPGSQLPSIGINQEAWKRVALGGTLYIFTAREPSSPNIGISEFAAFARCPFHERNMYLGFKVLDRAGPWIKSKLKKCCSISSEKELPWHVTMMMITVINLILILVQILMETAGRHTTRPLPPRVSFMGTVKPGTKCETPRA